MTGWKIRAELQAWTLRQLERWSLKRKEGKEGRKDRPVAAMETPDKTGCNGMGENFAFATTLPHELHDNLLLPPSHRGYVHISYSTFLLKKILCCHLASAHTVCDVGRSMMQGAAQDCNTGEKKMEESWRREHRVVHMIKCKCTQSVKWT